MRFDIVTIFPRMVEAGLVEGVVSRGIERGLLDVKVHDLREHTTDRHRTVDDVPYGGGPGMVMKPEPLVKAVEAIRSSRGEPAAVVLLSPQGRPFSQAEAVRLSALPHVVLLCGRYEGMDERVRDLVATEELSIGDYVLSGGELPALVIVDAVSRLVPGVVGDAQSVEDDSFSRGLLDYPHYTRPAEFAGRTVPEVLLSGHHAEVRKWRKRAALERTLDRRPELLAAASLDDEEREMLDDMARRFLIAHPDAVVVDLGAGLDPRMYRLAPPPTVDWYDVDYPEVIDLRASLFPEQAQAHTIGASVTDPHWLDQIPADRPTMIVADGLMAWLSEGQTRSLLNRLTEHFHSGEVAFNEYGHPGRLEASVARRYGPAMLRAAFFASSYVGFDDPHLPERWNPRLTLVEETSTTRAPEVALLPPVMRTVFRLSMSSKRAFRKTRILRYRF